MDSMIRKKTVFFLVLIIFYGVLDSQADRPMVVIETVMGNMTAEIYLEHAPVTAENFLKHVDRGDFDGITFFRTVTMDNQPENKVKIEVIQASDVSKEKEFPPIAHENTDMTGIKHKDGVISMARYGPGSATSSFFICIGNQPELDFRGTRNPDGYGFAAFGKIINGMEVARKIHIQPQKDQELNPPIRIITIKRVK